MRLPYGNSDATGEVVYVEEPGYGIPGEGLPTRTSELLNDGDGEGSSFITEEKTEEMVREKLNSYSKVVEKLWIVNDE